MPARALTAALPALLQAEAQLTCPMRLNISEHCVTGQRAELLLNAAVLFRQPGHYMTIVRGHGQQQGWWLALNDSVAYWVPDALVQSIMEEGLLAYAVQYVQEGPDMSRSAHAGYVFVWGLVALLTCAVQYTAMAERSLFGLAHACCSLDCVGV